MIFWTSQFCFRWSVQFSWHLQLLSTFFSLIEKRVARILQDSLLTTGIQNRSTQCFRISSSITSLDFIGMSTDNKYTDSFLRQTEISARRILFSFFNWGANVWGWDVLRHLPQPHIHGCTIWRWERKGFEKSLFVNICSFCLGDISFSYCQIIAKMNHYFWRRRTRVFLKRDNLRAECLFVTR